MTSETVTIRQKLMMPAPPEAVFDLLVDPELHSELTGEPATGSGEVGGTMIARNGRVIIRHVELERGRWIMQEWSTDDWPAGVQPSRLEIGMMAIGKGTDLRMMHSGVPKEMESRTEREWYEFCWDPMFERLRSRALY